MPSRAAPRRGGSAKAPGPVCNRSDAYRISSISSGEAAGKYRRLKNNAEPVPGTTETKRLPETAAKAGVSESKAADALKSTTWSEKTAAKPGVAERKVVDALQDAAKSEEKALAKAGGKTAWIVGGIIAATVAVGAFIANKRRSAAAREQERQQTNTAARNIG